MLEAAILQFLKSHSKWAPLWLEKSSLTCRLLFLADVLPTREEKDLFQKILNSVELGPEEAQNLSQHWDIDSLKRILTAKRPSFVVGFGSKLQELFAEIQSDLQVGTESWKVVSYETWDFALLLVPDLSSLRKDAEAKKNLWSALKTAKVQLGKVRPLG